MSSHIIVRVLVSLLLLNLFASAQMYGYPTQYSQPYPYMQQYPSYGGDVNNFGAQGYLQVQPQNYPYPYQAVYPGVSNYAPQYPSYPSYPSYPPVSYPGIVPQGSYPDQSQYPSVSYPGTIPQGSYPDQSQYPSVSYPGTVPQGSYPDQSQYPSVSYPGSIPDQSQYPISRLPPQYPAGTKIYPANYPVPVPQSIPTPYGNIPVEIIDVDGSAEQVGIIASPGFNITEDTESTKLTPVLTDSKSIFDVLSNPARSTKYVKTEPTQTKIVRTLDPKGGKIHVEVQTNSPLPTKENEISNNENNEEDNDTTTTKWNLFG